ncbi:MAG TPA: hypothetical protein G4N92_02010 [Anaerolineae bacterium]|nr:hypothetical protein [Anaerolineae bacterium]
MNESFHLHQLQKIDSQINHNAKRIHEIDELLNANFEVEKAKSDENEHAQIFHQTKIRLQKINTEVEAKKNKISQCESHLYSGKVKNPKELQDLQNELKSLRKFLAALEDEQLEKLINFEDSEREHQKVKETLTKEITTFETRKAMLQSEKETLIINKNRLEVEREAILTQLTKVNIMIYERLSQEKRGLAVATLENNACSACGATLTPGQRQESHSPQSIYYCPSCGRIIYGG